MTRMPDTSPRVATSIPFEPSLVTTILRLVAYTETGVRVTTE